MSEQYLNVYYLEDVYGGPEEGGWWYETGSLVLTLEVAGAAGPSFVERALDGLRAVFQDHGNRRSVIYASKEEDYRVLLETHPGIGWPAETPRYE